MFLAAASLSLPIFTLVLEVSSALRGKPALLSLALNTREEQATVTNNVLKLTLLPYHPPHPSHNFLYLFVLNRRLTMSLIVLYRFIVGKIVMIDMNILNILSPRWQFVIKQQ